MHHIPSKRARLSFSDAEPANDAAEAAAAASAAAAHAAATAAPGDAHFVPMPAADGHPTNVTARPVDHAAKEDLHSADQELEAKRRWCEEKRKQIAMKKAKSASSRRGRKRMRQSGATATPPPSTEHMRHGAIMNIPSQVPIVPYPADGLQMDTHHAVQEAVPTSSHVTASQVPDLPGDETTAMYVNAAVRDAAVEEYGVPSTAVEHVNPANATVVANSTANHALVAHDNAGNPVGTDDGTQHDDVGKVAVEHDTVSNALLARDGVLVSHDVENGDGHVVDESSGNEVVRNADAHDGVGDSKGDDVVGQEGFQVDGAEDIMTAAQWHSLDTISHT